MDSETMSCLEIKKDQCGMEDLIGKTVGMGVIDLEAGSTELLMFLGKITNVYTNGFMELDGKILINTSRIMQIDLAPATKEESRIITPENAGEVIPMGN